MRYYFDQIVLVRKESCSIIYVQHEDIITTSEGVLIEEASVIIEEGILTITGKRIKQEYAVSFSEDKWSFKCATELLPKDCFYDKEQVFTVPEWSWVRFRFEDKEYLRGLVRLGRESCQYILRNFEIILR